MADYYHLFLGHTHFIWLVRIKRKNSSWVESLNVLMVALVAVYAELVEKIDFSSQINSKVGGVN